MGVKIRGESIGALGMRLQHEPSGTVITTEPPVDNGGDGSSFSPTDLCAASLGACASTIMRLYAARNGIALDAVTFDLEKEMNGTPRRLGPPDRRLSSGHRLQRHRLRPARGRRPCLPRPTLAGNGRRRRRTLRTRLTPSPGQ